MNQIFKRKISQNSLIKNLFVKIIFKIVFENEIFFKNPVAQLIKMVNNLHALC